MLKVTFDATLLASDPKATEDAIFAELLAMIEQGALIFFLVATDLVHIDTGMSIGSYLGLAAYLGEEIDRLREKTVYDPVKIYNPPGGVRMDKLPESGAALSTPSNQLFIIDRGRARVRFRFNTDVYQYKLHDPQWRSIPEASAQMLAFLGNYKLDAGAIMGFRTKYNYRTTSQGSVVKTQTPVRRQKTNRRKKSKP